MIHTGGSRDSHLRPMNGRRWPVVVKPPKNKSHYEVCHRNRWRYCTSFHDNIGGMGTCLSFTVRAESVEILGCLRRLAVLAWRLVLFRVKFRPGPAWFLTRCVTTELPSTDANPWGKSTVVCKTHERRALTISVRPARGGTGAVDPSPSTLKSCKMAANSVYTGPAPSEHPLQSCETRSNMWRDRHLEQLFTATVSVKQAISHSRECNP